MSWSEIVIVVVLITVTVSILTWFHLVRSISLQRKIEHLRYNDSDYKKSYQWGGKNCPNKSISGYYFDTRSDRFDACSMLNLQYDKEKLKKGSFLSTKE